MKYELKKTQVTFADTLRIVQDAVDACFDTDENGADVDFRPECKMASLQLAFCENYLGMEFGEDFDENFAKYMSVDINEYDTVLSQWYGIVHAVNDKIEFRKQKMLNQQNEVLTTLLTKLVKKEIEVQDLQKKVLEQTEKINSQYSKEEMLAITNTFAEVNKLSNNPEYLKAVAEVVHNDKTIKPLKKPQDHKKSQKKTGE